MDVLNFFVRALIVVVVAVPGIILAGLTLIDAWFAKIREREAANAQTMRKFLDFYRDRSADKSGQRPDISGQQDSGQAEQNG